MQQISIFLVDDHKIVRDGIKSLIADDESVTIIGEASSGEEFLTQIATLTPDVVLMDINLPDTTGIELTIKALELYPNINILILSMHMSDEFITNSIEAGAKGYLPKTTSQKELLHAIHIVSSGNEYYNNEVSEVLIKSLLKKNKQIQQKQESPEVQLTKREFEILQMVAQGSTNKEIADALFISIRTVETHKNNILQKLDLKSTVELVKYAIKNNIIQI